MQKKRWTKDEIELLKEHYGNMSREELHKKYLPERTIPTIAQKAKALGLTRQYIQWSADEEKTLADNWTIMPRERLLRMLPGRTWTQCRNQVNKMKVEGRWPDQERRNYAAIEPEERKRRSEFYNSSLKYKMGIAGGTSVNSFQNNKLAKNNKTGVRGVSRTKSGKFTAYIRFQGKLKYLGSFSDLEDAKQARLEALKDLQPEINRIAVEMQEKAAATT